MKSLKVTLTSNGSRSTYFFYCVIRLHLFNFFKVISTSFHTFLHSQNSGQLYQVPSRSKVLVVLSPQKVLVSRKPSSFQLHFHIQAQCKATGRKAWTVRKMPKLFQFSSGQILWPCHRGLNGYPLMTLATGFS